MNSPNFSNRLSDRPAGAPWAAWLQLELELDPAPILQLTAGDGFLGKPLAQRCPLCCALLVQGDDYAECPNCGAVVDL